MIVDSRPLLARPDLPEHVRSFTSADVLAVEHEIVDRLATRADAKTISVIEGAAGAGKTARLAATRERAIAAGRRMVVVTPTRKAAQVAEGAIGAASYSAAWLLHRHGFRWDEDGRWSRTDSAPDVSARLRRGDLLVVGSISCWRARRSGWNSPRPRSTRSLPPSRSRLRSMTCSLSQSDDRGQREPTAPSR